jgi:hypothetical protein
MKGGRKSRSVLSVAKVGGRRTCSFLLRLRARVECPR